MAQPPDDRRPPTDDEPIEPAADAPTIAWTPPEPPPIDVGDAPSEPEPSAEPEPAAEPAEPAEPEPAAEPLAPPTQPEPPAEPASPLISWAPSGGAAGTPLPGAPLVGWQVPDDAQRPSPIAGFAIAGVGARLVAYLIDGLLLAIANSAILAVVAPSVAIFDPTTPIDQLSAPVFTLETVLAGIIGIGLDFIYLVGLWTSRGRATLGQRILKLQVLDAASGTGLDLSQAVVRWVLLGGAVAIFGLAPVAVELTGLIGLLWLIVLLVTTSSHPLKQGVHDRAANSIVVQPLGASSNTAVIGCLVLIVLFAILPIIALVAYGGQIEQILSEVGQSI